MSDHKLNRRSDAEWLHLKPLTEGEFSINIYEVLLLSELKAACNLLYKDTLSILDAVIIFRNNIPVIQEKVQRVKPDTMIHR